MSYFKFIGAAALAFMLNACVSLSTIKTMQTMSSLDPLTSDMANLVFGIEATPKLKPRPDTSTFSMTIQAAGHGPSTHRFALVQVDPNKLSLTGIPQNRGKVLTLFRFDDEAKAEILDLQATMRDMKSKKTKGGSLSIGVEPDFCKTAAIDYGRERFSVYIAQGGKGDLMPLIDNMTIKDLLKQAKQSDVRDC